MVILWNIQNCLHHCILALLQHLNLLREQPCRAFTVIQFGRWLSLRIIVLKWHRSSFPWPLVYSYEDSAFILILLDLSAIFSTINLGILLDWFMELAMGSTVFWWFSSFLWDPFQSVLERDWIQGPHYALERKKYNSAWQPWVAVDSEISPSKVLMIFHLYLWIGLYSSRESWCIVQYFPKPAISCSR